MIATPVGAGQLGQLERLADELARWQVWSEAQVFPVVTVIIDADRLGFRQVTNDLGLVFFTDRFEMLDRFVARPDLTANLFIAVNNLAHLGFDFRKIIGAERLVAGKIIIEAVFDGRSNRHLRTRKQFLHRFGEDMGRIVTNDVERFRGVAGQNFQLAPLLQRSVQIQ